MPTLDMALLSQLATDAPPPPPSPPLLVRLDEPLPVFLMGTPTSELGVKTLS